MEPDEQQREPPSRLRIRMPTGSWRILVIGLLATQALGPHHAADPGMKVTVTSYRICVLHGCNRAAVGRLEPGPHRAATRRRER